MSELLIPTINTTAQTNEPKKMPKKKSMSSEKASKVKKDGHSNEDDFTELLVGSLVKKGTGKADVVYKDWSFSLKKICKRIQFALYSKNSTNWLQTSPSSVLCKSCLDIYPKEYTEYNTNKPVYKEQLRSKMVLLKEHLSLSENLHEYLNLIIFKCGQVDFLVMKDVSGQYIYYNRDVLAAILENVEVTNSQVRKEGDYPEQKVIIKCKNNKDKNTNLIEIEIRNSGENHYAEMLCVCNRDTLFSLLNRVISETSTKNNVVLKGKAVELLEHEFTA
jgi:hypothetical protein